MWSQQGCSTKFGNFFLRSRWTAGTVLVRSHRVFDLSSGGRGDDSERKLDEGLGAHDGTNRALFG